MSITENKQILFKIKIKNNYLFRIVISNIVIWKYWFIWDNNNNIEFILLFILHLKKNKCQNNLK